MRDALLGRVDQRPRLHDRRARPTRSSRIVKPISTAQWDIGRAFGTIGAHGSPGEQVEITTYRADSYDGVTRKPTVEFGDTLEGDLVRRDFTVNCDGAARPGAHARRSDRRRRRPRRAPAAHARRSAPSASATTRCGCCAPPASRRSSASTSTPRPSRRWRELRATLSIVSPERIQGELVRLLQTDDPVRGIRLLVDTGLMDAVPARDPGAAARGRRAPPPQGRLRALADRAAPGDRARAGAATRMPRPTCRCGSPRCCTTSASPRRASSSRAAASRSTTTTSRAPASRASACRRCGSTPTPSTAVTRLIELHLRFFGYAEGAWTDSAVRRYVRDAGAELERLHILTRADVTTRNARQGRRGSRGAYDDIERRIAELAAAGGARRDAARARRQPHPGGARHPPRAARSARRTGSCSTCASTRACSARRRPRRGCASGGPRSPELPPAARSPAVREITRARRSDV